MAEFILIPEPIAEDAEAVVTALETAAIFGSRGDGAEALRWLKRAAESSSDYGDDLRTLALARAAADLVAQIHAANTVPNGRVATLRGSEAPSAADMQRRGVTNGASQTPLPHGPGTRSVSPSGAVSRAPTNGVANGASHPNGVAHSQGHSNGAALNGGSHVNGSAALQGGAANGSVVPASSAAHEAVVASASRSPSNPATAERRLPKPPSRPNSIRPLPSDSELTPTVLMNAASGTPVTRSSLRPPPPSSRSQSPTPPPVTEGHGSAHSVTPSNGASMRPAVQSFRPSQPAPEIRTATAAGEVGLRAAARVSVLASSDQPGLFTVRVLSDSEGVQAPAVEAFLVFAEPNSRISR